MNSWGTKLYDNDLTLDVRDAYQTGLRNATSESSLQNELIANMEAEPRSEAEKALFWMALADTQWDYDRLNQDVKACALCCIRQFQAGEYGSLFDWKTLNELEGKLCSAQPATKTVNKTRFICKWQRGDTFAYPIPEELVNKYETKINFFILHKIGESRLVDGSVYPIVYVKALSGGEPPSSQGAFNALSFVRTGSTRYENRFLPIGIYKGDLTENADYDKNDFVTDERGLLPQYRLTLLCNSQRGIPKSLIPIGNFCCTPPPHEFVPRMELDIPASYWKYAQEYLIDRYRRFG